MLSSISISRSWQLLIITCKKTREERLWNVIQAKKLWNALGQALNVRIGIWINNCQKKDTCFTKIGWIDHINWSNICSFEVT